MTEHDLECSENALVEKIRALEDVLAAQHKRLTYALDALEAMVAQHCCETEDGKVDSMALSANAEAMLVLGDEGRLIIEPPVVGRRVIAHWPERIEQEVDECNA